jgi:transcriptional regulator with XRE-family HTH domain
MKKFEALLATARGTDAYWQSRVKLQVATQLQDLLAASGLNQEQLAQKLGVKPPQVSRILNALGNPTLGTLVKMAGTLGYVPNLTFVPMQNPVGGCPQRAERARTRAIKLGAAPAIF